MASSLQFTGSCFMYCTGKTASQAGGSIYDVLPSSSSDRRVYGFSVVSSDNAAQIIKIYITSATTSVPYQAATVNIPASSGTNGIAAAVDVFSSTMCESLFQKTRDLNGRAYFNLPAGWKIQMQFSATPGAAETITTHIFGETY